MATEAQKRAKNNYRKAKVRTLTVDLYQTDQDIIDKLNSVDKYATYIKQLIRDDIANIERKMTMYTRSTSKRTYTYQGFMPYGAGDLFSLDTYVEEDFSGNVTEQIIKDGIATFSITSDTTAELVLPSYSISFVKR